MKLSFHVGYEQKAVTTKIRMTLNDIYGSAVKEDIVEQYHIPVFYPLTGIYGIRDEYGLKAFSVSVVQLEKNRTKVVLRVPNFNSKIYLYQVMSPTTVAWNFKSVDTALRAALHKYLIK